MVSPVRGHHRRFQAETPLIALCRFAGPALCDGQTVARDDLVVFEIHYHDRIGENYFAKYAPRHEWWFYPLMTRDEVVLIKQWDSAGGLAQSAGVHPDSSGDNGDAPCTLSFHTAFTDPNTPTDAPGRQSI